ncbi:ribosomal protein S3 [Archangium sp. Cb G35]|uniref:DUF3574 domain-containing protein n=1 Tax=Archangium sp. Cb G35 TaxID=1920190 RepID=UPI000937FD66|nr:DUF3574 domain-containing protein [Archangium sp. Cb G35]OJT23107.1 ribosomal protein S3 [Archangium sp. Cb G35]
MHFPRLLTPVLLSLAVLTSACGEPEAACLVGAQQARTELLFGLDRDGAPPISDTEWQGFVDTSVTPLFKEGLTIVDAGGQYLMATGELVKENSKLMILLHDGSSGRSKDIDAIRDAFKQQFNQEAVLRIDTTACVAF